MPNKNNPLETLRQSIAELCHENEILRLLLQENWPPSQRLSPQAILGQARRESEAEFHSRSRTADTKFASIAAVPPPCREILEALSKWIQEARTQTFDRIEKSR
jgi:hypothetical protein